MARTQEDEPSLLYIERISQYVPLPPASLHSALPALCTEVFSPLLLNYYPSVKGIVLAYENVKLSSEPPRTVSTSKRSRRQAASEEVVEGGEDEPGVVLLHQIDEYASPYVWATASLLVWRPAPNSYLTATLTHQSATHITLSHLNTFAISVLKENLPQDWTWHAEQENRKKKGWDGKIAYAGGWWVDGEGAKVDGGTEMQIRVREWDVKGGKGKGHLRIEGSLRSVEERSAADRSRGKAPVRNGMRNGEVMEID